MAAADPFQRGRIGPSLIERVRQLQAERPGLSELELLAMATEERLRTIEAKLARVEQKVEGSGGLAHEGAGYRSL